MHRPSLHARRLQCWGLALGVALGMTPATVESSPPPLAELKLAELELAEGIYLARGSFYSNSWRRVARNGERWCVEIADGPPHPHHGLRLITISSLSNREGRPWVVDATGFAIEATHPPERDPYEVPPRLQSLSHLPHY